MHVILLAVMPRGERCELCINSCCPGLIPVQTHELPLLLFAEL